MAVYYKPQSPIQSGEDFIYPITTADQVKVDKDTRLNAVGVYLKNIDNSTDTTVYGNNATTLGGVAAEDYALKTDTAPDSSKLGGVVASGYALKTDTAPDSAKLGGKAPEYYIQPRNLLDNSDFTNPVNQRGKTSYSGGYGIDRWKQWSNSHTTTINDNSISISIIQQYIGSNIDFDKTYTVAAKKVNGSILCEIGTFNGKLNKNGLRIDYDTNTDGTKKPYMAINEAGDYVWAALYEGSYTSETLPPYVPKGYAAELTECQRYAYLVSPNMAFSGYITSSSKNFVFPVPCPPMRDAGVKPTVASIPRMTIRTVNGYSSIAPQDSPKAPSSLTVQDYHPDSYQMNLCATFSSDIGTNNTPAAAQFRSGDSALISLDL